MASLTSYQDTLGRKKAAHLLRRLTFGASKQEIDTFAKYTPQQAVEKLLKNPETDYSPPIDPATGNIWLNPAPTDVNSDNETLMQHVKCWWLDQMVKASVSAVEKMSFFMHTHFTTMESRMRYAPALYYQIKLFREYSLGNFKALAKKICLDHAMLRFLDGYLNEVGKPNENFAREFLELYTIGKGPQIGPNDYTHYTEDDIIAASKIFSGYKEDKEFSSFDPDTGLAQVVVQTNEAGLAFRHDASVKQFSHAFDNQQIAPNEIIGGKATPEATIDELDQLVDMVFAKEATAIHICRKLYRFFVYYELTQEVEQNVIIPLAQELVASNYELKPVLTKLFTSQHFYDLDNQEKEDNNTGGIIKSPLELVVGALRFFKVDMPSQNTNLNIFYEAYGKGILKVLSDQGLDFYEPYEVAGYAAYHQEPAFHRNWISTNYLARRYEFSHMLIEGVRNDDEQLLYMLDIVAYVDDTTNITDPKNAEQLVRQLVDYLLPEEITEERFQYFRKTILLDELSEINWQKEWEKYKSTGDDSAVRVQLESLIHTIIQSPEYQLS
ncbi:uncharacterized protein (DUF1800 family) [Catalinimonas alkaloidigena]|uniref:DUF1800 domain-containing protein n=1 Tax=Catalinimonas alkaloidigena TaxID=1075417 RepID=UPI002406CCE3|nr:DUF1800 domain-containing protein [Catalinimonas alkaloidigena]MDF9797657.1 uncharacterized protein (DUF1800 family) [Catalinimonas alkaloidigena]